jgi:hypothetical protein
MNQRVLSLFHTGSRQLFAVDAAGAFLTMILLLGVVRPLHAWMGLPPFVPLLLACIAIGLLVASGSCYLWVRQRLPMWYTAIGLGNVAYCIIAITILATCCPGITLWGILWFAGELLIILALAAVELRIIAPKQP